MVGEAGTTGHCQIPVKLKATAEALTQCMRCTCRAQAAPLGLAEEQGK
jgi:hypothetical protein